MSRPLLQLALDHSSLEAAQRDVMLLKDSVDIVEAGTILCLNEGLGAALAARVGTGVYRDFSEAQRDLQHPVRTLLPDMTAHQLYQQKYQRYQHLIAALQGFHARIKEHTL